jgi:excisionase family DNA binding protein
MKVSGSTRSATITLPDLMTSVQTMQYLGITKGTLCAWVRAGKLKAIRWPDGSYRFEKAYILVWIEERKTALSGPAALKAARR